MHSPRTFPSLTAKAPRLDGRRLIAALALVFFAFTNFAIQTHVHLLSAFRPDAAAASMRFERPPPPQNANPFDDPATCPLCQDIALAGHYTTPSAIALVLPALIALAVTAAVAMPDFVAAISHIWHGRAPPQD